MGYGRGEGKCKPASKSGEVSSRIPELLTLDKSQLLVVLRLALTLTLSSLRSFPASRMSVLEPFLLQTKVQQVMITRFKGRLIN